MRQAQGPCRQEKQIEKQAEQKKKKRRKEPWLLRVSAHPASRTLIVVLSFMCTPWNMANSYLRKGIVG